MLALKAAADSPKQPRAKSPVDTSIDPAASATLKHIQRRSSRAVDDRNVPFAPLLVVSKFFCFFVLRFVA